VSDGACIVILSFFQHKRVRPADANKITNSAQHPKSVGTAAIGHFGY